MKRFNIPLSRHEKKVLDEINAEREMSDNKKPTIAELEQLLGEPNKKINIMPDGSIVVEGDSKETEIARLTERVKELEEALNYA